MCPYLHRLIFLQITPMGYKQEAGMTLYKINRFVKVANEIFIENTLGRNGYNTKTQRVERDKNGSPHDQYILSMLK